MDTDFYKPPPLEEIILGATIASTLAVIQLPYKKVDGSLVPTLIFKGRPSSFHASVLALNFAFFGAVTTISHRNSHPRIARCCLLLARRCINNCGFWHRHVADTTGEFYDVGMAHILTGKDSC